MVQRLAGIANLMLLPSFLCVARLLEESAVLQGDREQARRYYEQALDVSGKLRHRPEIALTRLGMAEYEAAGNRPREALSHLAFCIPEFEAMKMDPALERAVALRERLGE